MSSEPSDAPSGRADPKTALSYVAPLLLAAVAAGQFAVAQVTHLSPWKGGGFGMFSTVDAPDSRFIRLYLVDGDERIPVLVPAQAQEDWVRARTFPTERRLQRIAAIVAGGTWIPYEFSRAQERYERLATAPTPGGHHEPTGAPASGTGLTFEELGLYRMVGEEEFSPPAKDVLGFDEVRLELWRYTFDPSPSRLDAERLEVVSLPAVRT